MNYIYHRDHKYQPAQYNNPIRDLGLTDIEMQAMEMEIFELELANEIELTPQERAEVAYYYLELGDMEKAYDTWAFEQAKAEYEWEQDFQKGREDFEKNVLKRTITKKEQEEVRQWFLENEGEYSDSDFKKGWVGRFGILHPEERIKRAEAQFQHDYEKLREEGYGEEYLEAWAKEHRPQYEEKLANLKRSGKGLYDLDDDKGASEFAGQRLQEERDAEENTKRQLHPDTDAEERQEFVVEEAAEKLEEVGDRSSRVAYAKARLDQAQMQERAEGQPEEGTSDGE